MRPFKSLLALGAVGALVATLGLPLTSNADPLPAEEIAPLAAGDLPATIPSLNWTDAEGQWSLTDDSRIVAPAAFAPRAGVFAQELDIYLNPSKAATDLVPANPGAVEIATSGADADDIEIILDETRADELGAEGYELQIAPDGVTITASDERGAFYGTRSLSQLLRQATTLPAGSSLDVPLYSERGVTLCACQINIQNDFIDRLLTDMADLKLNHLLLEMKLETDDPRNNTWSYYTRDDVAELVAKADVLGIDVIPEINSPGHLGIWLEHRPDLQLRNNAGNPNQNQLDLSHPDAFEFYTGLIDQYDGVFTTDYWHMGADEYMIGTNFGNYNALTAWSKETYGADATIGDAFIGFINEVNAYVKDKGKQLRIWNDGVISTQVVQLDKDIVVEFWYAGGLKSHELFDRGYSILNASQRLYFSRSALVYKMNPQNLWNGNWHPGHMDDGTVVEPGNPLLRGAKVSIWPDSSHWQTENEVEAEVFESLRFISQLTWQGDRNDSHGEAMDWATFQSGIDSIGRNPLWLNVDRQPLADGVYSLSLNGEADQLLGADEGRGDVVADLQTWQLTSAHDHFYQLRNLATGECLAITEGKKRLDVVVGIGALTTMVECVDPNGTAHSTGPQRNVQKWAIIASGDGYILRNALSNQDLSTIKGDETSIDFSATPTVVNPLTDQTLRPATGTLAQLPPHMSDDVWTARTELGAIAHTDTSVIYPGVDAEVTVSVTAPSGEGLSDVVVTAPSIEGLTFTPASADLGDIAAGDGARTTFTVSATGAAGANSITFDVSYSGGSTTAGVVITGTCGPTFTPTGLGASSEQTSQEPPPNGFWAAAFDGDPGTYWHSRWSGTAPTYPHWLSMDAGEAMNLCGVTLTPRQSGANGRAKDVNIYVSDAPFGADKSSWGAPVATAVLANSSADQLVTFDSVVGRYVIVEGTSNYPAAQNDVWMTMGEIALTGTAADAPGPQPTVTVTAPTPTVTTTATATATKTVTATPTVTTTATATATATATTTTTATATTTATTTTTSTNTQTVEVTLTPTAAPTTGPSRPADGSWVYTTPGYHEVNGRKWFTDCEPYSQTHRCTTQITATTVVATDNGFEQKTGWVFNNLTYLPEMTRAAWGGNPLATTGDWVIDGRQWRTECDTETTGRGGCRSYIEAKVVEATPNGYQWVTKEVFNNLVLFKR